MVSRRPVLIAGGGLGGLAAALALAEAGFAVEVLERRPAWSEAGAGIQIGPNGVHVLRRLGVHEALGPVAGTPDEIVLREGAGGHVLARLPLGRWIEARHGAPYWTVHRIDLHAALARAAGAVPAIRIRHGHGVEEVEQGEDGVRVRCGGGLTVSGHALIGADGLWSLARRAIPGAGEPRFAGKTAARAVVETAAGQGMFAANATGVWLSSGAHVVHYPVRAGREIAIIVVFDDAEAPGGSWGIPVDRAALLARVGGLAAPLRGFLGGVSDWRCWSLQQASPAPRWAHGRVALLGDAAHPILPFLAQGGVLALEDAVVLADALLAQPDDPAAALIAYETARMARADRVVAVSARNGRIYHMAPPSSWARDLALRALPGRAVMAGLDWLYGWRVPEPAAVSAARTTASAARAP